MKRLSGWLLPLLLTLVGSGLIIAGQLDVDVAPTPSLPDIPGPTPTATEVARATPTVAPSASASVSVAPTATPSPTPLPDDVVATQLQIEAVGINVRVLQTSDPEIEWVEDPRRADGRVYRGHEGVRESWERWLENFDRYGFT